MIQLDALLAVLPTSLWIGNTPVPASGAATFPVYDPATGQVLCEVADATPPTARPRWTRPLPPNPAGPRPGPGTFPDPAPRLGTHH